MPQEDLEEAQDSPRGSIPFSSRDLEPADRYCWHRTRRVASIQFWRRQVRYPGVVHLQCGKVEILGAVFEEV